MEVKKATKVRLSCVSIPFFKGFLKFVFRRIFSLVKIYSTKTYPLLCAQFFGVLGGAGSTYISLSSGESFNSLPIKVSNYLVDAEVGVTDTPFELTVKTTFVVKISGLKTSDGTLRYIEETLVSNFGAGNYDRYYVRWLGGGTTNYNWVKLSVPSFLSSYNDLSSLASALGVFKFQDRPSEKDANNITISGIYQDMADITNMPEEGSYYAGWGNLLVFSTGGYVIQLYCGGSGSGTRCYIRYGTASSWYEWKLLATFA